MRFGALIDERKRLMDAALSEGQTYLRNADIPEKYRAPALAKSVKIGQQTLGMNAELSGAQKDVISTCARCSTSANRNWARPGSMGLLMFAGKALKSD
ncbi:hypothetical protein INH39_03720 [Massilia violaceinigra]|uniref:Uncharacterized protein n=1 Tax=Massilia violaceinigra TaxID=2045208 RepID=A0ABY4AB07_9BURK|nr:hypothetical protein [Massilia violaceinigra]UOD30854.1 hypothetical protein INH39_03720 [Massilia violaceinigra]